MVGKFVSDDVRTPGPSIRTPFAGLRIAGLACLEGRGLPVIRRTKRLLANVSPAFSWIRPNRRAQLGDTYALVDCPECGEGRVEPVEVTVRARIESDDWTYRFTCPTCERRTVASTSREAALEAVEAGASLETWRLAADGGSTHAGPPLSLSDLLELRVALSEPDWLETLSTSGNGSPNESDR
jgi:predicted RNA-binding Zn-ribbon protein involved in translation (DUF1610 family)